MANEDGTVTVGVDRPDYYNQCWFTDGYFDFVPHFIDGMAAIPELAPTVSDHMLRSTSIIQKIQYEPYQVSYRTFDTVGMQTLRLIFEPQQILADGGTLARHALPLENPGWFFDPGLKLVTVFPGANEVVIKGRK
jgi:hypothetical protein